MAAYLTNKGKMLLLQGQWDDAAAGAIKAGLLSGSSIPTAIDTAAEVADLNTVTDLLGSATEVSGGSYARLALSRTNSAEDDANDRVNLDAADLVFSTPATGNTYGMFVYDATTDTNDTTRLLISVHYFASAIAMNGSTITVTIADLIRAS